jgi:GT2 family glycosyltransferase
MLKTVTSKSSSGPTVSVIVPAHRDGKVLRRCLTALSKADPQPEEILLVSDGGGEGVQSLAEHYGYRCFRNPSGIGPARARNFGASQARGELLFFVDSDVAVCKDSVLRIKQMFEQNPQTDAVIGSYDNEPSEPNFLSQYKNLLHHYVHQNSREDASTFWGACGAIRREVFLKSGGFDESYNRPCIEDIEFGYRLRKCGYKIRLLKTLQGKHLKRWEFGSLLKSDLLDRAVPWTELIFRDRMLINDLNLSLSNRLSVAFVFLFLGLLAAGLWRPLFAALSLAFLAAVLLINLPLYLFFKQRRGFSFMLKAIPWHIIYCVCCGLGFAMGTIRALLGIKPKLFEKMAASKSALRMKKSLRRYSTTP